MVEIARDGGRWRRAPTDLAVTGAAVAIVAVLAATAVGGALIFIAVISAIALLVIAVPNRYRAGALIAVATIGAVDGLPGPDLTQHIVTNGIYEQDFVLYALMGLLIWEIHSHRLWGFFSRGLGRALLMFAMLNLAWWVLTIYRTSWIPAVHINHAANFGRAFLYITILTPLFAAGMQRRDTRSAFFVVAGAWSLVISGASILGSIHQSSITLKLLHVTTVKQTGTLNRLYVHAEDLLVVALMFAIPFLLGSNQKRQRWFAALVAIFAVVAVALLQTRASYYGCIGGALVAAVVYMSRGDSRVAVKRLLAVFATLVVVIGGIFLFASGSGIVRGINQVTYRAASAIGAVNSANTVTSTVAERSYELHLLEQRLGGQYVLGLGFISPRDQPDINLPLNSIYNSDVGAFNVVMMMGVVGAVLYYLSLVVTAVMLIVKSRAVSGERRLYAQGALGACVLTMITSVTLVSFFQVTGICTVAAAIGIGAAVIQGGSSVDGREASVEQA
jgi:hypothetical protein